MGSRSNGGENILRHPVGIHLIRDLHESGFQAQAGEPAAVFPMEPAATTAPFEHHQVGAQLSTCSSTGEEKKIAFPAASLTTRGGRSARW